MSARLYAGFENAFDGTKKKPWNHVAESSFSKNDVIRKSVPLVLGYQSDGHLELGKF